jgi:hypothetical protein
MNPYQNNGIHPPRISILCQSPLYATLWFDILLTIDIIKPTMTQRPIFIYLFACFMTACSITADDTLPTRAQLPSAITTVSSQQVIVATPSDVESVQLLDYWVTETSLLSPSKERDVWQFVGARGDIITLRVIGYNIVPSMILQDPDGTALMDGSNFQVQLESDGVYTVEVTLDQVGDGSYDIGLGYADRPNPVNYTPTPRPQLVGVPTPTPPYNDIGTYVGNLTAGTPTGSILSDGANEHVFTFEGAAGELINIKMERISGDVDPFLTLFSPDIEIIAVDDNTGAERDADLRNIKLLEDGLYSVQATGTDNTFGTYSLTLSRGGIQLPIEESLVAPPTATQIPLIPTLGPALNGNRLQNNAPALGSLDEGDFAQFSIYAVEGELFTLGIKPIGESPLRAQIEMYGPEGELVVNTNATESNSGGQTIVPAFTAPLTGAYIILLSGEDGTGGDYVISYGSGYTNETIIRGEPPPNTRAEGNLQRKAILDEWHIQLQTGDVINIAVSNAGGAFDPYVELRTWDGELVTGDNNSGGGTAALIQSAEIYETNTYRIQIRDATTAQNTGQYTLIWRYINVAPTATPIPKFSTLMSLDDIIEVDTYKFFVFRGLERQKVRIRVQPKPGEVLDPVAILLDPSGNQIAEADDSDGTLNPIIELSLPEDGSYTVRVNGYLTGGEFDLYVEQLFNE